jgi:hypothetical protein
MIVSVSTIWGDTDVPGQLSAIDSAVESATAAAAGGRPYVFRQVVIGVLSS